MPDSSCQNIKLSIIIPAYNCCELITDTINSIKAQTFKDYEIIVVNDGSTDETLSVLQQLAKTFNGNMRILNVENGGPARARNLGIVNAVGEYLYFMDSDDLILPDMLKDMYDTAYKNQLDVCACGYTMENTSAKTPHVKEFLYKDFIATDKNEFRAELMNLMKSHLMYVVWNKLFKADFLKQHGISFSDYLSGEDRLFNLCTFACIKRFGFVNKPYYRYFLRGQESLANRYVENRFESAVTAHKELIKAYQAMGLYDDSNRAYIDFIFIKSVMSAITQLNAKGCRLRYKQKLEVVGNIVNNPMVKAAVQSADEQFSYSKKVNAIIRTGNRTLIYLTGKVIFVLQFKLNNVYLSLKHRTKVKSDSR